MFQCPVVDDLLRQGGRSGGSRIWRIRLVHVVRFFWCLWTFLPVLCAEGEKAGGMILSLAREPEWRSDLGTAPRRGQGVFLHWVLRASLFAFFLSFPAACLSSGGGESSRIFIP